MYLKLCLYKEKKDSDYLKYLFLIKDGKTINDQVNYDTLDKELLVTDLINSFDNIGLLNTLKIVEDCNLEFPLHKLLLPLYDCKDNLPASTYLCELAKKRVK